MKKPIVEIVTAVDMERIRQYLSLQALYGLSEDNAQMAERIWLQYGEELGFDIEKAFEYVSEYAETYKYMTEYGETEEDRYSPEQLKEYRELGTDYFVLMAYFDFGMPFDDSITARRKIKAEDIAKDYLMELTVILGYSERPGYKECVRAAKRAHEAHPYDFAFALKVAIFLDVTGIMDEVFDLAEKSTDNDIVIDKHNVPLPTDLESRVIEAEDEAFITQCMDFDPILDVIPEDDDYWGPILSEEDFNF